MNKVQTLFDRRGALPPAEHPLYKEAAARLHERLKDIKRPFKQPLEWSEGATLQGASPDLITSILFLHNAGNLAQELTSIFEILDKGGLFMGVLLGEGSLCELRTALMEAELAINGGASPRLHPFPDALSLSRLLPAAGFALPVIDQESVTLVYPDAKALMRDLRQYGCANKLHARSRRFAPRTLFKAAEDIYASRFPAPESGIAVRANLVFLHGWKE
jgi:hypothetical protein